MTTAEATQGIMRKVQALLERAAHPGTPEAERLSSQEMADRMMAKYRLDRAMLNFNKKSDEVKEPVVREYEKIQLFDPEQIITKRDAEYEVTVAHYLMELRAEVYRHSGCQAKMLWSKTTIVGYEEDIFFGDMLWASVFMDATQKVYPKWDRTESFDANVYRLKKSGYSWPQVREMGLAVEAKDKSGHLTVQNAESKLRTAYKREAERNGQTVEPGRQQPSSPGLWRVSFMWSYFSRLKQRMERLKEQNDPDAAGSSAIALIQDEDRIKQKFYGLFPDETEEAKAEAAKGKKTKNLPVDMDAYWAGHAGANKVNLQPQDVAGDKKKGLS